MLEPVRDRKIKSFLNISKKFIFIGLKIYATGVFLAKFGMDIESQFGIKEMKFIAD